MVGGLRNKISKFYFNFSNIFSLKYLCSANHIIQSNASQSIMKNLCAQYGLVYSPKKSEMK